MPPSMVKSESRPLLPPPKSRVLFICVGGPVVVLTPPKSRATMAAGGSADYQDELGGESSPGDVVEALKRAFVNERCAPDLLPHQDDLVNDVKERINEQARAHAAACSRHFPLTPSAGHAGESDQRAGRVSDAAKGPVQYGAGEDKLHAAQLHARPPAQGQRASRTPYPPRWWPDAARLPWHTRKGVGRAVRALTVHPHPNPHRGPRRTPHPNPHLTWQITKLSLHLANNAEAQARAPRVHASRAREREAASPLPPL
eukprot:scaffold83937_cov66-Phaeocystis_antarctica.AAC.8